MEGVALKRQVKGKFIRSASPTLRPSAERKEGWSGLNAGLKPGSTLKQR